MPLLILGSPQKNYGAGFPHKYFIFKKITQSSSGSLIGGSGLHPLWGPWKTNAMGNRVKCVFWKSQTVDNLKFN